MKIFVYDEFSPEDTAMLQALYSRSAASVKEHAEKVKQTGSGKFMERYYVGYGHASIADCGSTTIFLEGVSMLVAKAIQDWPLYSGQETSSRYIDMSQQAIVDPVGSPEAKAILDRWMAFYVGEQAALEAHLRAKYPLKEGEKPEVYAKAIAARVFDIMRGFLPAGVSTQLSWHTNLRQAHDKLALLAHHPLIEVQTAARQIHEQLKARYAHSFGHELYPEQEAYRQTIMTDYSYYDQKNYAGDFMATTTIKVADLAPYQNSLSTRPLKTNLPLFLAELGSVTFDFLLDFGSFRDIQRHRNGVCRMPLLSTKYGFNQWYLDQLPPDSKAKAEVLIADQIKAIESLVARPEDKQYYCAMGFNVSCRVTYGLPATVYTVELRSGRLVHPSLRQVAHKMHQALGEFFPDLKLHSDLDPDDWDIRRGLQDIKEKK